MLCSVFNSFQLEKRFESSYSPQPRRRPPSPRSPPQQPQPSLQSLQRSPQYRTRTLSRSLSGSKYYSSEEDEEPIFRETVEPTSCLAIFGLNIYTTRHKLFDIFSKFGSIEKLQIVVDPESGRSRGFCFIYYAKMADAKTAKEVCTGSNIDQRRIRIDYSRVSRSPTAHRRRREREYDSRSPSLTRRPPSPARSERYSGKSRSSSRSSSPKNRRMRSRSRSRSRSGSRGRRPDKPPQSRCIGVFGLSVYTTQQRIREVFSKFGPIERIQVVIDAQTGRSRGFCFIYYESEADAKEAKDSCSGMELDSRRIRVDYSITERPHSPTPGVYMGRPTRSFRQREYRERYREEYRPRRYASPPPPYDFHHHHARIRYERAYEDRSMSPPRYSRHKY